MDVKVAVLFLGVLLLLEVSNAIRIDIGKPDKDEGKGSGFPDKTKPRNEYCELIECDEDKICIERIVKKHCKNKKLCVNTSYKIKPHCVKKSPCEPVCGDDEICQVMRNSNKKFETKCREEIDMGSGDEPTLSTKPTQPTKPTRPTLPTKPTRPTLPTKPTLPTLPTKPTRPTLPTKPTRPTLPTKPTRPTLPTKPTRPTLPTKPTRPTLPTKPTRPTLPTKPTRPTLPTKPTRPTLPTKPSDPTKPTHPTLPTQPTIRSK